jgi:hypothetical protein
MQKVFAPATFTDYPKSMEVRHMAKVEIELTTAVCNWGNRVQRDREPLVAHAAEVFARDNLMRCNESDQINNAAWKLVRALASLEPEALDDVLDYAEHAPVTLAEYIRWATDLAIARLKMGREP